jgi:hypothetical protein
MTQHTGERYAVNLADMMYPDMEIAARFAVAPVNGGQVDVGGDRFDRMAVLLDCDAERATAIIAVLRLKRARTRAYVSAAGKGWKAYPAQPR